MGAVVVARTHAELRERLRAFADGWVHASVLPVEISTRPRFGVAVLGGVALLVMVLAVFLAPAPLPWWFLQQGWARLAVSWVTITAPVVGENVRMLSSP